MDASPTRRLQRIRIEQVGGPCASLVLALESLLETYGRQIELCELGVVSGNAFMTTYAAAAPPRERWNMYGRHAFLVPTARQYGLILRDLHPPEAAPVPNTPPEFDAHFRDSYLPFVEAALARDEPVLAWKGWPPPQEAIWGLITGLDAGTGRCVGQTMFSRGRPVEMPGPPAQVYVVQDHDETRPDPAVLMGTVLRQAGQIMNNRLDPCFGVVTGVAALRRWHDTLIGDQNLEDDASLPCDVHLQTVQAIIRGRQAAIEFFEVHCAFVSPSQTEALEACTSAFRDLIACLKPFADEENLGLESEAETRRRELAQAVAQSVAFEERAAQAAAPWSA
jgi:hypothetical protein